MRGLAPLAWYVAAITFVSLAVVPTGVLGRVGSSGQAAAAIAGVPLTIQMSGRGRVVSTPAGLDCVDGRGTCSAVFLAGTSVDVTASPAAGFRIDSLAACPISNPSEAMTCRVDLGSRGTSVGVTFSVTSSLWLEVGGAGVVRATPLGAGPMPGEDGVTSCAGSTSATPSTCSPRYEPGRKVLLEAVPSPNGVFAGWSDPECGEQLSCTVAIPSVPAMLGRWFQPYDLSVAASFGPVPIGALVAVVGGGRVTSSPTGIDCTWTGDTGDPERCLGSFSPGTTVTLHAESPRSITWDEGTCTVVPGRPSDCTLVAQAPVWVGLGLGHGLPFREAQGPQVYVRYQVKGTGTGTGRITGDGVDCGSRCTADYVFGYRKTFTAQAAAGSHFVGWRGVGCTTAGPVCTITVGASSGVHASFELDSGVGPSPPPATPKPPLAPSAALPAVLPAKPNLPATTQFSARVLNSSSVRHGRQRTLNIRLAIAVPVAAQVSIRGPHALLMQRTYRLRPPRPVLRIALRRGAPPGRYHIVISLRDANRQTKVLRLVVAVRR
jgi:hypothetical protein